MASTFRIVLRQEEGYDAHQTREFDLEIDSKFAIGRASKNVSKGYLLPAKNNVYIDSPVVSREHAILTANTISGTPQVHITDTKSMHGTYVNGVPLVPHTPKQLFNGDTLQFGVNVNRNESYFVAFKYTFNAELTNPEPFSRGFTVPEAESEEEELGFAQAGRGSQLDPLILDDSDATSEHEDNEEEAEQSEDMAVVTLAQLVDDEEVLEIDISSLVEEEDAADGDAEDYNDSVAASAGSAPEYSPESPLVQDAQYVEKIVQVEMTPFEHPQSSRAHPMLDAPVAAQTADSAFANIPTPIETFAPLAWQGINNHVTFPSSMFDSTVAPPLPPRPSQKRQRIWDEPLHEEPERVPHASSNVLYWTPLECEPAFGSPPVADRIHTSPPAVLAAEASDPFAATGEAAVRESGLTVPEFVDEQPPTPTSIKSCKRSADDAFDEEIEDVMEQSPAVSEANVATREVAVPTVEQVASQRQRPIALPKSILSRAFNAAKVMVPATALGAVFTVGALTALPESFFTVA